MVLGNGFDPRAPVAYECISTACPRPVDVIRIGLPEFPQAAELAELGRQRLESAVAASGAQILEHDRPEGEEHASGLAVTRAFFKGGYIDGYDEVLIDVSALPRSIFFPLIKGMLELVDREGWRGQLHVVACDNPEVDALVTGEGVDAPRALSGFAARSSTEAATRIWVPVLGENEVARVEALYLDIRPSEICPALPFPAANPRRADELILAYRPLLIETIDVELRNFIYAAEYDPFDLYRKLSELNGDYAEMLESIGETRMILSAHSSKLLSVGVLLAAYEQQLEVRHASPSNYMLEHPEHLTGLAAHDLVVDLWLTGEPYA